MLTLKDFYSTAFSIFGNSTPVSMDFSTKFNFCSVHMCLNPRKSLKTKKNALNFKKRLIFNKNPDFLVILNIYDVTVTSSFVRSCLKLIFKFVLRQYPPMQNFIEIHQRNPKLLSSGGFRPPPRLDRGIERPRLDRVDRSEPTYKSQRIKLLDVIAACNQLNVNVLNKILITIFSWGRSHRFYLIESRFLIAGN